MRFSLRLNVSNVSGLPESGG